MLYVDEYTKKAELRSPNYPHLVPNSLDCQWVLSVPTGHKLKFTMDPKAFNLQNAFEDECNDDYIEIRDGASQRSPLIGK